MHRDHVLVAITGQSSQIDSYNSANGTSSCSTLGQATLAMYCMAFVCSTFNIIIMLTRLIIPNHDKRQDLHHQLIVMETLLYIGTVIFSLVGLVLWSGCTAILYNANATKDVTDNTKMLTGYDYLIFGQIMLIIGIILIYIIYKQQQYQLCNVVIHDNNNMFHAKQVQTVPGGSGQV